MLTDESFIDLLSTEELLNLPPVSWLMDGMIPELSVAAVYGPPGEGKSFIVLDWAVCISEGMAWHEHKTKQAPVIYVAAEGGRGIQKRIRGLMQAYGLTELAAMYYLLDPLFIRDEGVIERFLEKLEEIDVFPGLVIIDTLSQSFGGGEENSSADMGEFMIAMRRLAIGRSMSMLVVHHTNATGNRERGHTAFRGNLDVLFSCRAEKNGDGRITLLTLKNDKQKDNPDVPAVYLQPRTDIPYTLVFEEAPTPERKKRGENGPPKLHARTAIMQAISGAPDGITWNELRLATGVSKNTLNAQLRRRMNGSEIYKDEGRYFITPANEDCITEEDV